MCSSLSHDALFPSRKQGAQQISPRSQPQVLAEQRSGGKSANVSCLQALRGTVLCLKVVGGRVSTVLHSAQTQAGKWL